MYTPYVIKKVFGPRVIKSTLKLIHVYTLSINFENSFRDAKNIKENGNSKLSFYSQLICSQNLYRR